MSLSERIAGYKPARIGGSCSTCKLIESLPEADSKALVNALADPRFSTAGLSKILKDEGYSLASSTIGRHRRGECQK